MSPPWRRLASFPAALFLPATVAVAQEETRETEFRRIEAACREAQNAASNRVAESKDEAERASREAADGEVLHRHLRPTSYVIDAAGVIRHRDPHGEDLRRAVEGLVAEAGR